MGNECFRLRCGVCAGWNRRDRVAFCLGFKSSAVIAFVKVWVSVQYSKEYKGARVKKVSRAVRCARVGTGETEWHWFDGFEELKVIWLWWYSKGVAQYVWCE